MGQAEDEEANRQAGHNWLVLMSQERAARVRLLLLLRLRDRFPEMTEEQFRVELLESLLGALLREFQDGADELLRWRTDD